MPEAIASGGAVATEVVRQPRAQSNRADAPVREAASVTLAKVREPEAPATEPRKLGERIARPQSSPQPKSSDSALTTYKDSESGRLIIRIFDKETGDVLLEFPPEDPPSSATLPSDGAATPPSTQIDV